MLQHYKEMQHNNLPTVLYDQINKDLEHFAQTHN